MNKPTYTIQVVVEGRYDYAAVLADLSIEPPERTTVMAKSMAELMAKVLVACVLRDKRLGEASETAVPIAHPAPAAPIILTPSRSIVPPTGPTAP